MPKHQYPTAILAYTWRQDIKDTSCAVVSVFPICTFCYLWRISGDIDKSKLRLARWQSFVRSDYIAQKYWFRHLIWLVQACILGCNEYLGAKPTRCVAIVVILGVYVTMLFKSAPFAPKHQYLHYSYGLYSYGLHSNDPPFMPKHQVLSSWHI